MNLPNGLTIFRILLIPVFIILLVYQKYTMALIVFGVAGLTDALDGLIARIWDQRTRLGTYLDPLADKLLLTSSFVTFAAIQVVPVWSTIVVASRDVILMLGTTILYVVIGRMEVQPSWLGKGTTVIQLIYILAVQISLVADRDPEDLFPLLVVVIVATVVSGLHYIYRGVRILNDEPVVN